MKFFYCTLFFVLINSKAFALQEEARTRKEFLPADSSAVQLRAIDSLSLSKFYADADYVYDRELPATLTLWDRLKHWIWEQLRAVLGSRASRTFWKIFPYVFVAGVVVFVLMHLLKAEFGSVFYKTKPQSPAAHGREIKNLHAVNFDALLAEAIAARQYRLAVRYLFLQTLQRLAEQKRITWQVDKTNHDYLRELRASSSYQSFQELVWWFEYVWYGDFLVNEAVFERVQTAFRAFEEKEPRVGANARE